MSLGVGEATATRFSLANRSAKTVQVTESFPGD